MCTAGREESSGCQQLPGCGEEIVEQCKHTYIHYIMQPGPDNTVQAQVSTAANTAAIGGEERDQKLSSTLEMTFDRAHPPQCRSEATSITR